MNPRLISEHLPVWKRIRILFSFPIGYFRIGPVTEIQALPPLSARFYKIQLVYVQIELHGRQTNYHAPIPPRK